VILAIDQGTTGTSCLVFDRDGTIAGRAYSEFEQHFPRAGWVEHDAGEIWDVTRRVAAEAIAAAGIRGQDLLGIGITNQRETVVAWDPDTGEPVHRALVWQDRRTAARCDEHKAGGHEALVRERTGLVIDPYFSGTKIEWLLQNAEGMDRAVFGTVDSWLAFKLTGRHVTDYSNASRTMLFDIRELRWDPDLCELLGVDPARLPEPVPSAQAYGRTRELGGEVPVAGIAGDQQAALVRHGCFDSGEAKATYGTGSFVLAHAGARRGPAPTGLLQTVAASGGYALEGAILASGAAIQWLRDGIGILADAAESERLARTVDSTGGVSFVPAFAGLGSPHWDADARGLISGITRGTTRAHLVRAALEGIAFQVADVLEVLPGGVDVLRADGGASANGFLMQFQADLLGCRVEVAAERETTALGAAALAGRATGLWPNEAAIRARLPPRAVYEPASDRSTVAARRAEWRSALGRALG
jgi:glycerol kinase